MEAETIIKLVYQKDFEALKKVLSQGTNLNVSDSDGRTPLMHAVLDSNADDEMVKFLLKNGAEPNSQDISQKWTALHFATRDQKLKIVSTLLDGGAIVDTKDSFGNTPLWRCVMESNAKPELIKLLVDSGASPLTANALGVSPLQLAEKMGRGTDLLSILESSKAS